MLTCWLEGKGFMWSVVKSNALAQDPTSTGCIPLVFSFSAPIVSPLFSFSFYLLLSLALTSLESQEICSFSFILCLHLLQSIAQHVPKLPFFYTWYECCTGERASKWLSDFSSICHTLSCHLSNCTYTFRMHQSPLMLFSIVCASLLQLSFGLSVVTLLSLIPQTTHTHTLLIIWCPNN